MPIDSVEIAPYVYNVSDERFSAAAAVLDSFDFYLLGEIHGLPVNALMLPALVDVLSDDMEKGDTLHILLEDHSSIGYLYEQYILCGDSSLLWIYEGMEREQSVRMWVRMWDDMRTKGYPVVFSAVDALPIHYSASAMNVLYSLFHRADYGRCEKVTAMSNSLRDKIRSNPVCDAFFRDLSDYHHGYGGDWFEPSEELDSFSVWNVFRPKSARRLMKKHLTPMLEDMNRNEHWYQDFFGPIRAKHFRGILEDLKQGEKWHLSKFSEYREKELEQRIGDIIQKNPSHLFLSQFGRLHTLNRELPNTRKNRRIIVRPFCVGLEESGIHVANVPIYYFSKKESKSNIWYRTLRWDGLNENYAELIYPFHTSIKENGVFWVDIKGYLEDNGLPKIPEFDYIIIVKMKWILFE